MSPAHYTPPTGPYATVDPVAVPLAGAVLEALLAAYDDPQWGLESPCVAGLVSGSMLIADHCCAGVTAHGSDCEGQLTVRVAGVWPTEEFPAPRQTAMPVCGSSWAVELELAVLRCALTVDTDAQPPILPSMEEEMLVAELALADMGLIRHVVSGYAMLHDQALVIGSYTPMGPQGGCVGGGVTVTFLVE